MAYASNTRNSDTVSIEVCHPDETGEFSPVTYDRTVELTAWLCREFRLDPSQDVIRHYDVTGKICPKYYVDNPEAWDDFRADVALEMERQKEAEKKDAAKAAEIPFFLRARAGKGRAYGRGASP